MQRRREVAPLTRFTYVVWHELAHRYINDIKKHLPCGTTPLLKRYAAEPPLVRHHLHLFALDQLLHERLGRASEYRSRHRQMTERSPNLYGRALAIVDREGAKAFVDELRAPRAR